MLFKVFFSTVLVLFLSFSFGQLPDSIKANELSHLRFGLRYDLFSQGLSDWTTGSIEYNFSRNSFQLIPRLTFSNRFDRTGLLAGFDIFKTFANRDYLNASGAIATSSIFPTRRATVHYFNPFGKWENSVGLSFTHFTNFGDFFTVIAGLSRYYSNWLSTVRTYLAIQPEQQINNLSFYNENRCYLTNYSYFSFSFRYGFDSNFISVIDNSDLEDTVSSVLYGAGLTYNSPVKKYFQWKLQMEWSRNDFELFERDQYTLSLFLTKFQK